MSIYNYDATEFKKYILKKEYGYLFLILGIAHILLFIYFYMYPILINVVNFKTSFHYMYIFFCSLLLIQWVFLKNECVINYFEKKIINENYVLGTNGNAPGADYFLSSLNINLFNTKFGKKNILKRQVYLYIIQYGFLVYILMKTINNDIIKYGLTIIIGLLLLNSVARLIYENRHVI
jgi:hypothetical protein